MINKHADSEDVLIQRKARVSTILRSTVGSLLLPLFSALWGQDYTPKDAARLVPSVSRLMRVIDTLTAGMLGVGCCECVCCRSRGQGQF